MGETLGISRNVFEKMAAEKDRKERMKKYEEWQKDKARKQKRIALIKVKVLPEEILQNYSANMAKNSQI